MGITETPQPTWVLLLTMSIPLGSQCIHFLITPFPADNTPVSGFLNTTLSSLWSNGLYSHQISIQQSIFGIHRKIHQKIQWCEPTNLQPSSKGRRAQTSTISFNFQHKFLYNVIKNLNLDNNSVKKIILTCCSVIFNIFHSVGAQISADTCCFYRSWGRREDKRLRPSFTYSASLGANVQEQLQILIHIIAECCFF